MKDLTYYMGLPYTITLKRDEEGDVIASIPELIGCFAHGSDEVEALTRLKAVQEVWILDHLETGDPIPEVEDASVLPSGRWVQRVPRSLHRRLAEVAKQEQVSLNQFVTGVLAEAVGRRHVTETNVGERSGTIASLEVLTALLREHVSHFVIDQYWRADMTTDWHVLGSAPRHGSAAKIYLQHYVDRIKRNPVVQEPFDVRQGVCELLEGGGTHAGWTELSQGRRRPHRLPDRLVERR